MGDSLGLPYEGLSRHRAAKLLGPAKRHRFLFHRGMVSDDTEHTCMVAQALLSAHGDVEKFQLEFARRLKYWFATLPAGVGMATAKACLKLWLFIPPRSSGVFSAGNGPAMRAAVIGVYFDHADQVQEFVRASTVVTHTDPKACSGALAVALAANLASRQQRVDGERFLDLYEETLNDPDDELLPLLKQVVNSVKRGREVRDFASQMGCGEGVSGYVLQTVPVAIHAWLSHQGNYPTAVMCIIECGGDADTTAAIVGGIMGASVGAEGIPLDWQDNIIEWPRTINWMIGLGQQLAQSTDGGATKKPPRLNIVAVLIRNLFFLLVVLSHGFRRLLPPY